MSYRAISIPVIAPGPYHAGHPVAHDREEHLLPQPLNPTGILAKKGWRQILDGGLNYPRPATGFAHSGFDFVFLAVKTQHTETAIQSIEPHLGPGSVVVSLQNGLNAPEIARGIGASRTMGSMVEVVREGVLVARAEGIRLEPFDHLDPAAFVDVTPDGLTAAYRILDGMAAAAAGNLQVRTGSWRDIVVRKRKTEIFALTGEIVRRGERLGIPTPVNRRQLELFDEIEAGRRAMSWANLDELLGKVPVNLSLENRAG